MARQIVVFLQIGASKTLGTGALLCCRKIPLAECPQGVDMLNSQEKAINCTDIPVATRIDTEDTRFRMQLAQFPFPIAQIDRLSQSLETITSVAGNCKTNRWVSYLLHPIVHAVMWREMRKCAAMMEEMDRESSDTWKRLLEAYRGASGKVFALTNTERSAARDECSKREASLDSLISSVTGSISRTYPRTASRIIVAATRIKQVQCRNFKAVIVLDDPQMNASADRHYADGTLMDLETFANGLQGF